MASKDQGPKFWINIHLNNLAGQAMSLGLMSRSDTLTYEPGSRVNGIAPGVWIITDDEKRRRASPDFLPRFTLKHTAKDVELALESAYRALFAVNYRDKD